jgi:hypothetical protein
MSNRNSQSNSNFNNENSNFNNENIHVHIFREYNNPDLYNAVIAGNTQKLKNELTRGPRRPTRRDLHKLLTAAIYNYTSRPQLQENIIKVLLNHGAPVNRNTTGRNDNYRFHNRTPLGEAVRTRNSTIVKLLLDHGANANQRDAEGFTPLHRASEVPDNATIIRLLIRKGVNVDAKTRPNVSYWDYELTALHIAAYRNNIENVRTLVDIGKAKVNLKSGEWNTPLHKAIRPSHGTRTGLDENIVQFLIDRGAHINVKNNGGRTPLHEAAVLGKTKVVKILLENGAIPFIQDSRGLTPYDYLTPYIERMIRTWPGERSVLRRMATASINSVRNRTTGQRLHIPNNIKQRILSRTGLFNRNQLGRPTNRNMSQAEIRNAWKKEQNRLQNRKRKRNENQR